MKKFRYFEKMFMKGEQKYLEMYFKSFISLLLFRLKDPEIKVTLQKETVTYLNQNSMIKTDRTILDISKEKRERRITHIVIVLKITSRISTLPAFFKI